MDLIIGVNKGTIINVPENDKHEPRPVDGDIKPNVTVPNVATFVTEDGGKTFQVVPVGPGTTVFTANADADPGTGVKNITGNPITVNVALDVATHIASTEGQVIPQ